MIRLVSIVPLLAATSLYAQSGAEEQMETAGPVAITIFALLFFGACAVYAWFTWRNERKDRQAGKKNEGEAA